MQIKLMINGEERTFVAPFLSGKLYKDFFEMQRKLQEPKDPSVMNTMIDFVCRVYGNQFTIDQYWEGVPLNKVLSEIVRTVNELGELIMEDVEGGDGNTQ
nr:hypothetical protein [uncultured Cellulosilyticum sp.]